MSSNRDKIFAMYADGAKEDARPERSRTSALEFHYTKKHLQGCITKDSRVLEVGCGTGYYGMYYADKCREYVGIDLCPQHIEIFKRKIAESGLKNVSCSVGDATDLDGIANDSFDVVLCLGPMYHLPPEERDKVFDECGRVCKKGGMIAFAYINTVGVYAGACVVFGERYPDAKANEALLAGGHDDLRPDTFYFMTPEEINAAAEGHGLLRVKNLGTDFFVTMGIVDSMTDERFELMKPLYDRMTSHESCTGMSNHALLVCRKEK